MAYVNQEKKQKIKVELDKVLKGTGVKYTLAVNNHSTIVCNIKKGPINFLGNHFDLMCQKDPKYSMVPAKNILQNYLDVNPYWYQDHFTGEVLELIKQIFNALNTDNFDKSDVMSDYFHVGHYVDLNIGKYNKPYELTEK